jgi:ABC-type nitrate/sulfonate/bicarbonate transport system permease component
VAGLRAADRDTIDLLRSVGASRRELLAHVEIPAALGHLFAGLRTGVALSLIGAVIGEWFALVSQGLGRQIQKGVAGASAPLVWASAFALGAIGAVSLLVLAALERVLLPGTHGRTHPS